ncbi:MAG: CehA/McbA family metallohydrolase [Deltaproteobacteria bacterium]|nr:CehA/McbA family metallohydrolase [Deltaproteobacteria bacterium]
MGNNLKIIIQPDLTTTFDQWGFMLRVENGQLVNVEGLGGITQPEDCVPILHPDDHNVRWREFLWMHYTAVLLTLTEAVKTELVFQTCGGERRIRVAELTQQSTPIQTGDDGRLNIALYTPCTQGRTNITPEKVVAGGRESFTIQYVIGETGIVTGGGIYIFTPYSSWSSPDFDEHTVKLTRADGLPHNVVIETNLIPHSHSVFGFFYMIRVRTGSLQAGDVISIHYGAREGICVQTYPKDRVYFTVLVDTCASGIYYPLPYENTPYVKVCRGTPNRLRIVAPMVGRPGDMFVVRGLVLDGNYNPSNQGINNPIHLKIKLLRPISDQNVIELKTFTDNDGRFTFEHVQIAQAGYFALTVQSSGLTSASLVVKSGDSEKAGLYWGSLHGHSEMSDGEFGPEEYYRYGRDDGLVDFCSLTDHDWELFEHYRNRVKGGFSYIQQLAEKYNVPGHFVTFSAYEWMGINKVGHINVYYNNKRTDNPMYVGEVAILERTDADTPEKLVDIYKNRDDVLLIPHTSHGTTWPVYDSELMRLVEIYSCWGCSENHLSGASGARAGLEKGFEMGFIGGADSHHGSPGHTGKPSKYHCLPEREGFAVVYADDFTRNDIFKAMQARRCYATTGERILLEFSIGSYAMGQSVTVEPSRKLTVRGVSGGTKPMTRIELIRDGKSVAEGRVDALMGFLDETILPLPGKHYYYLRATQQDGERAWSSPIWLSV